jgi:hypothetical protein
VARIALLLANGLIADRMSALDLGLDFVELLSIELLSHDMQKEYQPTTRQGDNNE